MAWWGIDIGGANLKWVDERGQAHSRSFPLWQRPAELAEELAGLFTEAAANAQIAATMTGELCDSFETKSDGVRHIASALRQAGGTGPTAIYGVDGRFHSVDDVLERPLIAAASNWHALATFAARWLPQETGMLVDIGSTTADLIPIKNGKVATQSRTDTERLVAGELVYTGVGRTPLMALVGTLPYRGAKCPVAAEFFASTADAYFLLYGHGAGDTATADQRPMTRQFAIDRLARSICADRLTFAEEDALLAAREVEAAQVGRLRAALEQVVANHSDCGRDLVVSGSGEWLAQKLVEDRPGVRGIYLLSDLVGARSSQAATALAVATLVAERG